MTTEKQRKANKLNATKSTGPKITESSKFNAMKHGIFSSSIQFTSQEGKVYQSFLDVLNAELKPKGIIQEMGVQRLARAYWRLKLLYEYENATIQEALLKVPLKASEVIEDQQLLELLSTNPLMKLKAKNGLDKRIAQQIGVEKTKAKLSTELETILRYEVMLERQISRLLEQIENE